MPTEISGRNYDVNPKIRDLITKKLARIEERLFDDVIDALVVLDVQKYRNICEILIVGKEHDVKSVQESDASMEDAVNAARAQSMPRVRPKVRACSVPSAAVAPSSWRTATGRPSASTSGSSRATRPSESIRWATCRPNVVLPAAGVAEAHRRLKVGLKFVIGVMPLVSMNLTREHESLQFVAAAILVARPVPDVAGQGSGQLVARVIFGEAMLVSEPPSPVKFEATTSPV